MRVPLQRDSTATGVAGAKVALVKPGTNVTFSETVVGDKLEVTINASGGGGTPASSVVSETSFGLSPIVGTSTNYARQDHSHGSPTIPLASSVVTETAFGQSSATGTSTSVARADHTHGTPALPLASTVVTETAFGQSSAVGTSTSVARADHTHGTPVSPVSTSFLDGYFGDGSDGDATLAAGTTTLTRETHYNNLTLAANAILKPAGFRIFVKGTLTFGTASSINDDGNNGAAQVGGTGLASRGYLGGQGGAGGDGWRLVATGLANGNAGSSSGGASSLNNSNLAPTGGAGGNSSTRTGGSAGTAGQPSPSQKWSGRWQDGRYSGGAFSGGSGGGGGAITVTAFTSGAFVSGGGGSGGGAVWVAANNIVGGGLGFSAKGGNGANASTGVGTGNCGGGGGGGGGCVAVICKTYTSFTVSVAGGTGGTSASTGGVATDGAAGRDGNYIIVVLG